jgi:hypothetical protein
MAIFCSFATQFFGPVVQLNRTSDSGSEGRGFESRRDYSDAPNDNFSANLH